MQVNLMVILGNVAYELVVIRAACKILEMRSKVLFGAAILGTLAFSLLCRELGVPEGLRAAIVGPISFFVIPMAFSRGPLLKRFSRTCLLVSAALPVEFIVAISYSLLSGQSLFPSPGAEVTASEYAFVYTAGFLASALTHEVVITYCMRTDDRSMAPLNLAVIALIVESYVFFGFLIIRVNDAQPLGSAFNVAVLVCTLLSFAIAVTALEVAHRDALALRSSADQAAIIRQTRHVRQEVTSMADAASTVRKLRHDLANQMGVIDELLNEGQVELAGNYVAELQRRAEKLAKEA